MEEENGAPPTSDGSLCGTLPDELLVLIIVSTGDARAVARFGQTCRRMRAIVSDDGVWRSLYAALYDGDDDGVQSLQRVSPADIGRDWRWLCRARLPSAPHTTGYGVGTITFGALDYTYEGDLYHGRPHGRGYATWVPLDSHLKAYRGQWFHGEMHGRGIAEFRDGAVYDGEWARERRHGRGVYTWPDGDRYEGDWVRGTKHGRGTYTWPDGERYEGDWVKGAKHGRGTYTCPDGRRHEGDWAEDKKHGRGIAKHSDGTINDGEWADDALLPPY